MPEVLEIALDRRDPLGQAVCQAARFFLAKPEALDQHRFFSRLVVRAAVAAGWQAVDLRGYFDPRLCEFCRKPIPDTLSAQARHFRHRCAQNAHYERKRGRKMRNKRRGDPIYCADCGTELAFSPSRQRCAACQAERTRQLQRQRQARMPQPIRTRPPKPPMPPNPPKPPPPIEQRTCPVCGTTFEVPANWTKIYCRMRCKYWTRDEKRRQEKGHGLAQ